MQVFYSKNSYYYCCCIVAQKFHSKNVIYRLAHDFPYCLFYVCTYIKSISYSFFKHYIAQGMSVCIESKIIFIFLPAQIFIKYIKIISIPLNLFFVRFLHIHTCTVHKMLIFDELKRIGDFFYIKINKFTHLVTIERYIGSWNIFFSISGNVKYER